MTTDDSSIIARLIVRRVASGQYLFEVGEDKVPKVYVFSPMSSDATEIQVEKYRCPAPY